MNPNVHDWLNLIVRWAHVLAAIMWIGDSFLFMWLDSHLRKDDSKNREGDVIGELWMAHGGGFYELVKRRSLAVMPEPLYSFKWESYSTWITGFFLVTVVYYLGGAASLVAPGAALGHGGAVALDTDEADLRPTGDQGFAIGQEIHAHVATARRSAEQIWQAVDPREHPIAVALPAKGMRVTAEHALVQHRHAGLARQEPTERTGAAPSRAQPDDHPRLHVALSPQWAASPVVTVRIEPNRNGRMLAGRPIAVARLASTAPAAMVSACDMPATNASSAAATSEAHAPSAPAGGVSLVNARPARTAAARLSGRPCSVGAIWSR